MSFLQASIKAFPPSRCVISRPPLTPSNYLFQHNPLSPTTSFLTTHQVDLRLPPQLKPKPPNFPTHDPATYLLPLFDAYASPSRAANLTNPRLNPILAAAETLPRDMLFIIPTIDILLHEQLTFVERLKRETEGSGRRIESRLVEGQWHGWAELPGWAIDKATRDEAFDAGIDFLRDTHRKYGWVWDGE